MPNLNTNWLIQSMQINTCADKCNWKNCGFLTLVKATTASQFLPHFAKHWPWAIFALYSVFFSRICSIVRVKLAASSPSHWLEFWFATCCKFAAGLPLTPAGRGSRYRNWSGIGNELPWPSRDCFLASVLEFLPPNLLLLVVLFAILQFMYTIFHFLINHIGRRNNVWQFKWYKWAKQPSKLLNTWIRKKTKPCKNKINTIKINYIEPTDCWEDHSTTVPDFGKWKRGRNQHLRTRRWLPELLCNTHAALLNICHTHTCALLNEARVPLCVCSCMPKYIVLCYFSSFFLSPFPSPFLFVITISSPTLPTFCCVRGLIKGHKLVWKLQTPEGGSDWEGGVEGVGAAKVCLGFLFSIVESYIVCCVE